MRRMQTGPMAHPAPDRTPTGGGRRTARRRATRARPWAALLLAAVLPLTAATPALGAPVGVQGVPGVRAAATPPFAEQLTPDLIAMMQRLRIPGAIVSVSTPEWGTWTTTLGTGDLATGAPIRTDQHLRVGSITKTFTATVVLQLVQEGRLTLDDPVSAFRPEVPDGEHITVRQLLQMTSGLYNYSEDPAFNERLDQRPESEWTPQELLDIAFGHPAYFPPGGGWHYSNTNYVLLGLIAEQLTGRPLARLFQERIFNPVGMHETTLDSDATIPEPHAEGYQFISNVASLTAPTLTGKDAAWADWSAGNPYNVTHVNASWAWAAGAASSTVDDLRRWAPALATGTLLSPELQRERLNFIPTSDQPGRPTYGLGIADVFGFLGHDGQIPGYNAFVGYDPERCATVVVLVNLNQSPDGTAPSDELTKLILAKLFPQH
ncbi:serine hydrolase domain-containing protein [Kitasatospora sp. McL0602]|uniref:serine hydrolase domain-containing protein n=1 Tax=Kitasatospora sp. McL0602 TaxID=3439530 RepID=UPI003F8AAACB